MNLNKPQLMGMSRLTTNKKYHDMQELGDRVLCVFLGRGSYHFTTYNNDPMQTSVSGNIAYPPDSEGKWVYLYYQYKRSTETVGRAVAYVLLDEEVFVNELTQAILHSPLNDYLLFLMGSVGPNY